VNEQDSTIDVGDEPLLFKRALSTLPVAVCEDRVAGIQRIDKEKSPGVVVLDDAFQHRKLVPGFSVLLMDYKSFSHPSFLLPAGNERDLWSRRKMANVVIVTKCPTSITDSDKYRILSKLELEDTNASNVFFSQLMYGHARSFDFLNILDTSLTNRPVILVTGIAKPEQMFSDVSKQTRVLKHLSFRDHYNFTRADVELMKKNMAMFADQRPLFLTTSKDRVRIEPLLRPDELKDWLELPIETSIDDPKRFNTLIENYVKSNQRNGSLHP
jgi:tetraacyldisaccharide 4'-kinase